jgi:hypothetical protein
MKTRFGVTRTLLWGSIVLLALTFSINEAVAQSCTQQPTGLVGWWPGDGNANDIKGSNHGTLENGATFDTGKVSSAFRLDGTNDFVKIPKAPELDMTDQVTVEFWMKADADNLLNFCQGLVTTDFYLVEISPCGLPNVNFVISTNSGAWFQHNDRPILAGEWIHVAGVYDSSDSSSGHKLYLNGVLEQAQASIGSISAMLAESFLAIGSEDGRKTCSFCQSNRYFKGLIDEVSIYNRALSDSEIMAIYSADSAGKCKEMTVGIDIKPGSPQNTINPKSKGVVPVAILSRPGFDAITQLDQTSLTFGRTGDEKSLEKCVPGAQDVNRDGLLDRICHFDNEQAGFSATDIKGVLKGKTTVGTPIRGSDLIRIVP